MDTGSRRSDRRRAWSDRMSDRSSRSDTSNRTRYSRLKTRLRAMVFSKTFGGPIEEKVCYENTYKMEPEEEGKFSTRKCQQIIYGILESYLSGKEYNGKTFPHLTKTLADLIKERVKSSGLSRYKIVSYVTVVEKREQGLNHASRCLWDDSSDNFASAIFETPTFFVVGNVYATYYE
ncbi:dynein light chain Tctex-type protein 2B-like [Haliotis rubra]|uniref:dynein light chain Tctex-type protein 2B-like n=1 Tax=Haliotis rubra TaxID=36100 RepID=UPI001EE5E7F5|nr:dynein light chain Tctex-type protein 2B-like [Haliotis rubra]